MIRHVARRLGGGVRSLSAAYWEARYALGGTSGAGSQGRLAQFKAHVLNTFVREYGIERVIELGCGDGRQLARAAYPQYIGLDVSRRAVAQCTERFAGDRAKSFFLYDPRCFVDHHRILRAELALSLDVIYHLVEDAVYARYMQHLFGAAERFVIIYSSNERRRPVWAPHVRHRRFARWVARHRPEWRLPERTDNPHRPEGGRPRGTPHDFYVYARATTAPQAPAARAPHPPQPPLP